MRDRQIARRRSREDCQIICERNHGADRAAVLGSACPKTATGGHSVEQTIAKAQTTQHLDASNSAADDPAESSPGTRSETGPMLVPTKKMPVSAFCETCPVFPIFARLLSRQWKARKRSISTHKRMQFRQSGGVADGFRADRTAMSPFSISPFRLHCRAFLDLSGDGRKPT